MPELNEEQGKYLFSLSAVDIVPQGEGEKKRTFKGTAYGGGRVDGHWFWGRNGNGYSPCGCGKKVVVIGSPSKVNNLIRAMCCVLSRPPKKP